MAHRIGKIRLLQDSKDQTPIDRAALSQDVKLAIADLEEVSSFCPTKAKEAGIDGPFDLDVARIEGRLLFTISTELAEVPLNVLLSLTPFRRTIQDYKDIIASYGKALRENPAKIEAIDMARRGLHNEAATLLIERLENKIELDFDTARRLITLILALESEAVSASVEQSSNQTQDTKGVLFVCTRNAVRSAMAEAMMKSRFGEKDLYVDSAGLDPADVDGFAVAVLKEQGLALDRHESKDISAIDLNQFSTLVSLSEAANLRLQDLVSGTNKHHIHWNVAEPKIDDKSREATLVSYRHLRETITGLVQQFSSKLEA